MVKKSWQIDIEIFPYFSHIFPKVARFLKAKKGLECEMGIFEVQGIVSAENGLPLVQLRQLDENGVEEVKIQVDPIVARDIAHNILEAAANAIYEAALFSWAKEKDPENGELMGIAFIDGIRRHRSDKWGLPDRPEDWRPKDKD